MIVRNKCWSECTDEIRVKSGKFGWSAKFGQRPCLFHILTIGIKNKLSKQTVKIMTSFGFPLFVQMYVRFFPGVRSYPTLPYFERLQDLTRVCKQFP